MKTVFHNNVIVYEVAECPFEPKKDNLMKISDFEIYDLLRSYFPGDYPALRKVPRKLDHPGDCPKAPKKTERVSFSIGEDTDFASFAKYLDTVSDRGQREIKFSIHKEVVGTELIRDRWDGLEYEVNVYGDINKIGFMATVEVEGLAIKQKEYEQAVSNWEGRIKARREREKLIASVEKENGEQIFAARKSNLELWRLAAKSLSGKLDVDFKSIVRGKLLEQLRELDEEL